MSAYQSVGFCLTAKLSDMFEANWSLWVIPPPRRDDLVDPLFRWPAQANGRCWYRVVDWRLSDISSDAVIRSSTADEGIDNESDQVP